MRARCEALDLPIVYGHGDLKPSNVMSTHSSAAAGAAVGAAAGAAADADAEQDQANSDSQICFIDFELAGQTYRGYDLYKLFRTTRNFSNEVRIPCGALPCSHPCEQATKPQPAKAAGVAVGGW